MIMKFKSLRNRRLNTNLKRMILQFRFVILIGIITLILLPISNFTIINVSFSSSQIRTISSVVIGSLSSISGIVITVYILAFTLFEKNFASLVYDKNIGLRLVFDYFQIVISTIIIFLINYFLVIDTVSNYSYNLTGFGLLLYLISLGSIFILIRNLITESKSEKYVTDLLPQLDDFSSRKYMNPNDKEELENNPFFKLHKVVKTLILNDNRLLLHTIVNGMSENVNERISKVQKTECREYIEAVIRVYDEMFKIALQNEVYWLPKLIMENYFISKKEALTKHKSKYIFTEYDRFIEENVFKMIRTGNVKIPRDYLWFLFDYVKLNIEFNTPDEKELLTFAIKESISSRKEFDHDQQAHWDVVSSDTPFKIRQSVEDVINNDNNELLHSAIFHYRTLMLNIIESTILSKNQSRSLLMTYNYGLLKMLNRIIDKEKVEVVSSLYDSFFFEKLLEQNDDLLIAFYNDYERMNIKLFKTNQMTTFELNNFAVVGRSLAKHVSNESVKVILKRMVMLLSKIAKIYVSDISFNDLLMYKEIYKQAQSIVKWVTKDSGNREFADELSELLKDLDDLESIDELMEDIDLYYDTVLKDLES